MDKLSKIQKKKMKDNIPEFAIGDIVRVHVKIVEGGKQRIQPYEGTAIARKGSGINKTFTVRRISYGEGVERTFLINSPTIEKIKVVRSGKVKRSKLYYLRKKIGKKTKVEEKVISVQDKPSVALPGEEG